MMGRAIDRAREAAPEPVRNGRNGNDLNMIGPRQTGLCHHAAVLEGHLQ